MPDTEILVALRVSPGTRRVTVGGRYGTSDVLKVAVRERAVDGRANAAVQRAVAEAFGIHPSHVRLARGLTSRSKVVALTGEAAALRERLHSLLDGDTAEA